MKCLEIILLMNHRRIQKVFLLVIDGVFEKLIFILYPEMIDLTN